MKRFATLIFGLLGFSLAANHPGAIAQNTIAQHLVISEVRVNGTGSNETDEFVEIYNPTNKSLNLKNWTVSTQNATGGNIFTIDLTGFVLGPGKFLLVGDSIPTLGVSPDVPVAGFSLTNSGGSVALKDTNNLIVDDLGWGTNPLIFEGAPVASSGADAHSLERKASATSTAASLALGGAEATKGNGQDTDINLADFVDQDKPSPQNSSSPAEFPPGAPTAVIEISGWRDLKFALKQNYPNPFNPTTTVTYSVPNNESVSLRMYDVLGREVAALFDGYQTAGEHTLNFDASSLDSGTYFLRLQVRDQGKTRRVVLVR
jgi:hypothetical protein